MIPQSFIQDLLARVDIVDVVGKAVRLRKGGANWMGLCPFHQEKSPSFTVSPTKQFYHCFGCGAHGTALGFLMEHAGLGYRDAVADLARSVGLTVPDDARGAPPPERAHPALLAALSMAAAFYAARLRTAPRAIAYLKGRGVTGETAARFGLGYAPDGWRSLEATVPDYAAATLVEAGLVVEAAPEGAGEGRGRRYDRFRDRIIFPIRNMRGEVIGLGGRVLEQGEPKYLNSPETPVFSKGRELYGLYEARSAIRAHDCVLVVEGYMDVVMLAQHGVAHVVATLGTATTPLHVQKLLRLADRVVFAFDGDAAGQRAAWRALEACLPHATDTKRIDFLTLPTGHDPDSLVRAEGAEGFLQRLAQARALSAVLLHGLERDNDLATAEGRARYQAQARPLLRTMPKIALRVQVLQALAQRVGVRMEDVVRYVDDEAPPAGGAPVPPVQARASHDGESGAWRRGAGMAGRAPWTGRYGRSGSAGEGRLSGPPMPRTVPDLQRRVRLLLTLHPALAHEEWSAEFLPAAMSAWLACVAEIPLTASWDAVLAHVRQAQLDWVADLVADRAQDRGLLAELALDEARHEIDGAFNQLRAQAVRAEIDRLVASGLVDEGARARYAELLAWRKRLAL